MERNYLNEWKTFLAEVTPGELTQSTQAGENVATADGKMILIDRILKQLNFEKNDKTNDAMFVAQTIYMICAAWMNKTGEFAHRPGKPRIPKAREL